MVEATFKCQPKGSPCAFTDLFLQKASRVNKTKALVIAEM